MNINRDFVEWNDDLYEILRSVKESNRPNINVWKEYLKADKLLKKDECFLFCRKVENAIILDDMTDMTDINKELIKI